MRIERDKAVVVAVDYQEKLMPVMSKKEALLEHSMILLKGVHMLEVPIIVTQQYTRGLGDTVKEIREVVESDEYVEKISFSAWEDIRELTKGKKFVILCGIESHICVLQTLIDAKADGMIPVLVTDCISSRLETDKEYAIERAKQEGAIVTTYEALLFELLKEAGTKESRKIQSLIK